MGKLATPNEMVWDIIKHPEQMPMISAGAFVGLLKMAQAEKEKANCGEQSAS